MSRLFCIFSGTFLMAISGQGIHRLEIKRHGRPKPPVLYEEFERNQKTRPMVASRAAIMDSTMGKITVVTQTSLYASLVLTPITAAIMM